MAKRVTGIAVQIDFSSPLKPAYEPQTWDELINGECKCGRPGTEDHTCPYACEIQGDDTSECNCCNVCEKACGDDI